MKTALQVGVGGLPAALAAGVAHHTWAHVGARRRDSGHPQWREALEAPQIPKLTRLRIAAMSAAGAIAGLFAYEIGQVFLPIGTFDVHDMIWTLPGALIGFLLFLRSVDACVARRRGDRGTLTEQQADTLSACG